MVAIFDVVEDIFVSVLVGFVEPVQGLIFEALGRIPVVAFEALVEGFRVAPRNNGERVVHHLWGCTESAVAYVNGSVAVPTSASICRWQLNTGRRLLLNRYDHELRTMVLILQDVAPHNPFGECRTCRGSDSGHR